MIPSQFDYHRPPDLTAAVGLIARLGEEAQFLAGGHSLIPMMRLRMAAPEHLVDLGDVAELRGVEITSDTIRIGAMTTQGEMLAHAGLAEAAPILHETARQIADPQVRARGTIGGNVANGDPGNDMPALMMALGAVYELAGPDGRREVAARAFYESAFVTARAPHEVLVALHLPRPPASAAYVKQKRKIGDYATAAAAVVLHAQAGRVTQASVAMTNLSDVPVWSEAAGQALIGTACTPEAVAAAIAAMQADIDPTADNRGPVEFKRHVAGVMLSRAIAQAWARV